MAVSLNIRLYDHGAAYLDIWTLNSDQDVVTVMAMKVEQINITTKGGVAAPPVTVNGVTMVAVPPLMTGVGVSPAPVDDKPAPLYGPASEHRIEPGDLILARPKGLGGTLRPALHRVRKFNSLIVTSPVGAVRQHMPLTSYDVALDVFGGPITDRSVITGDPEDAMSPGDIVAAMWQAYDDHLADLGRQP